MSKDQAQKEYITEAKKIQGATTGSSNNNNNTSTSTSTATTKPKTKPGASLSPSQSVAANEEGAARPGDSDLAQYVSDGNLEKIKEALLDPGVNVNASDEERGTVLHIACDRGNKEHIQLLLEKKADVSVVGAEGTPLHSLMFSITATVDIIDLLVEAKVRLSCLLVRSLSCVDSCVAH